MSGPSRYTLEFGPDDFDRVYALFITLEDAWLSSHYDEDVYTLTEKGREALSA